MTLTGNCWQEGEFGTVRHVGYIRQVCRCGTCKRCKWRREYYRSRERRLLVRRRAALQRQLDAARQLEEQVAAEFDAYWVIVAEERRFKMRQFLSLVRAFDRYWESVGLKQTNDVASDWHLRDAAADHTPCGGRSHAP